MNYRISAIRLCSILPIIFWLSGCGPQVSPDELPELPVVATASVLPAVASQLERLRSAVDDDPLSAKKTGQLGMAYLAYQQNHAAEVALHRARLLQPRRVEWMYFHVEALTRLGRYSEAVTVLERVIAKKPNYLKARTRLGLLHLQLGQLDEAKSFLSAVLAKSPDNIEVRLGLARLHLRVDEPDAARTHLEYLLEKSGHIGSVYFALSDASRRLGDIDKAAEYLALFERYRHVAVPAPDPWLRKVYALDISEKPLLRASRRLNQQGRPLEAIEMLERALERNPDSHLTRASLVGAYGALKQFDKAEEHYQLALATAPPTAPLLRNLARVRMSQGLDEAAREALVQALTINPHDAHAMVWLGIVYLKQNKTAQGEAMLTKALNTNPEELLARAYLAEVLHNGGRHEGALIHLQELAQPETKYSPRAWRMMGQSYQQLGQTRQARDAYTSAVASAQRLEDSEEERRSASLLKRLAQ